MRGRATVGSETGAWNVLRWGSLFGFFLLAAGGISGTGYAAVAVDEDGAVHLPAMTIPQSDVLSAQGKAYVRQHLRDSQAGSREGAAQSLDRYLARQRELFAVQREDTMLGGVHVFNYLPREGLSKRSRHRVLINLHGGGFSGCWPQCAELESIPIASVGGIRVVSVDYREGPKYRYPAASEDVASVYRALLESHAAADIGIYGCSAGGLLTAMSVAWFQKNHLPRPGAVGIFCAGAAAPGGHGFVGDSSYVGAALGSGTVTPMVLPPGQGYMEGAELEDPAVSPVDHPDVLARFPPTLIITASRDVAQSSALYAHRQLVNQGVEAELHAWDGLFHAFFYNPDVPESRECYRVIAKFFARRLGRTHALALPRSALQQGCRCSAAGGHGVYRASREEQ